ncbi:Carbon-nitrogen hydrolase [Microbacterium testaceum StLB037]|uniref:Carbon-nitrogen hydrolase n=1 Tax=Microbacterium testaceum (strain StLB037) TaxID=979556 RepID=A0A1H0NGR6_MICTS|nr:carbon-nitrogen hydrolase family protein [Microbacterium testaceum]SDO91889.1 Carbon-nitrogen hydrolase [Microbacterium testaceum StLB037]
MTRTAHSEGRPTPVFRECDGAPWPSDDELELETEWAAFHESGDVEWWTGEEPAQSGEASSAAVPAATPGGATSSGTSDSDDGWSIDDLLSPLDGGAAAVSDIDARLGHLECVVNDRQRATADEYRLILAILDDAAFDPTPWVGPDPTLDRAWNDPRGCTPGAVRRDRIDLAERAAVAEVAVRLRLSEQTVRTRAAHVRTLAVGCPQLWTAFSEGRVSEKHAVDAARLASTLPAGDDAAFQRFDDEACPQSLVLPPAKFAVAARAIRFLFMPGRPAHPVYAKQHLHAPERAIFSPGTGGFSFRVGDVELALSVCYDANFPEHAAAAAAAGATVYLNSGAYFPGGERRRDLHLAARALDNGIYVVFSGLVGAPSDFIGGSAIFDPLGRRVAHVVEREGLAIADIDPAVVQEVRRDQRMWIDRRDDLGSFDRSGLVALQPGSAPRS